MHQAIVGLHQEEQPPRPREQTILRARQEDGQGLRKRPHPRFWHGQVPLRTLVLSVQVANLLIHGLKNQPGGCWLVRIYARDFDAIFPVLRNARLSRNLVNDV